MPSKVPAPSATRQLLETYRPRPRVTPQYYPPTHRRLDLQQQIVPPYPHPRARWYKQANNGLYGGAARRSGGNVAVNRHARTRTLRVFRPNLHRKRLWSEALQRTVRVKVVARVLRTIDKVGGLDEYLLGEAPGRIKELGMGGWALRWRLMRSPTVRKRMAAERERLGLEGEAPWEVKNLEQAFKKLWAERQAEAAKESTKQLGTREQQFDSLLELDEQRAGRGEDAGILLGEESGFMQEKPRP